MYSVPTGFEASELHANTFGTGTVVCVLTVLNEIILAHEAKKVYSEIITVL